MEIKLLCGHRPDSDVVCRTCAQRERDFWKGWVRRMSGALEKIAKSAPCRDNHESFHLPGNPCDQRIASNVLEAFREEHRLAPSKEPK